MANDDISGRAPDPLAERLRRGAEEDLPGPTFAGFYIPDDDPDYGRIYLDEVSYVRFLIEDVETHADIPAERSPVLGEPATAVRLRRGAAIVYVRDQADDDFRLMTRVHYIPGEARPTIALCPGFSTFYHY